MSLERYNDTHLLRLKTIALKSLVLPIPDLTENTPLHLLSCA